MWGYPKRNMQRSGHEYGVKRHVMKSYHDMSHVRIQDVVQLDECQLVGQHDQVNREELEVIAWQACTSHVGIPEEEYIA